MLVPPVAKVHTGSAKLAGDMDELIQHLLDQPIANVIVLAGVAFLFIAAVGKVAGKIEPDARGRIICGVLGVIMVPVGLIVHGFQDSNSAQTGGKSAETSQDTGKTEITRPSHKACKSGYVWREALPNDHVCVTPEMRTKAASDNRLAPSRTANGGPYGADTCLKGFVWREAAPGDHICVTGETRRLTREDNSLAETRIGP
jgi:hypothetical protein